MIQQHAPASQCLQKPGMYLSAEVDGSIGTVRPAGLKETPARLRLSVSDDKDLAPNFAGVATIIRSLCLCQIASFCSCLSLWYCINPGVYSTCPEVLSGEVSVIICKIKQSSACLRS